MLFRSGLSAVTITSLSSSVLGFRCISSLAANSEDTFSIVSYPIVEITTVLERIAYGIWKINEPSDDEVVPIDSSLIYMDANGSACFVSLSITFPLIVMKDSCAFTL